eukprot:CAMPEP_0181428090 /NCGR_PEP_ID=MMETSP1110-20121109/16502_1 /TAXON_ID=174948 /ORGANISM="Symbiodinium sp., Strain CCMP421" /LENGTH=592 /DNA_ID=CAMNT_0023551311 /DNA_START=69 /DNA_END=1847 /DNA_ORIENTATION=-
MDAACKRLTTDGGDIGAEIVALVRGMMAASAPEGQRDSHPVVILEGMDGTGKSTLLQGLAQGLGASTLRSPPKQLQRFRQHFDQAAPELRRAFYAVGNYACAAQLRLLALEAPVVVDRFWPSTAAYTLACDLEAEVEQLEDLTALQMPRDLVELLPNGPMVWLLLDLPEEQRALRVRRRALSEGDVTQEELCLERSAETRRRLQRAFRAVKIAGEGLEPVDALGDPQEVLARTSALVSQRLAEWRRLRPRSVNWHFTRLCNYQCKFCFHTAKSSFFLPSTKEGMEESKQCLRRLRLQGMQKINFSGGEPFLQKRELGELVRFCKKELHCDVSIVSNGSKITRKWMESYGEFVDILAISCDSFEEETNVRIGRGTGTHLLQLENIKHWCDEFQVPFKINSVINVHNIHEDMSAAITRLQPKRWKVFQCLLIEGENAGEEALRDAKSLTISQQDFDDFCERHGHLKCLVREDNGQMMNSYLILDEHLRFLNCTGGAKTPSDSIREVSVIKALRAAGFDAEMFEERGGVYDWSKAQRASNDIEDTMHPASEPPQPKNLAPVQSCGKKVEDKASMALLLIFALPALAFLAVLKGRR